jgi:uncharacterized membrane protein YczE
MLHGFGSVGIGTVVAAVLVGIILGRMNKAFGSYRDKILGIENGGSSETAAEKSRDAVA